MIDLKNLNRSKMNRFKSPSIIFSSVNMVGVILLVVSVIINTPYLFIFRVDDAFITKSTNNSSVTATTTLSLLLKPNMLIINEFGHLKSLAVVYFLKDFVFLVFVCVFNLLVTLSLRNNLKTHNNNNNKTDLVVAENLINTPTTTPPQVARNQLPNGSISNTNCSNQDLTATVNRISKNFNAQYRQKEKKVSYMILFLCILFLIGHLPETLYRLKRKLNILFITNFNYLDHYLIISNMISFVSSYLNLFIYLGFSKMFSEQFKETFVRPFYFRRRPIAVNR
jgi:hypothetical protein